MKSPRLTYRPVAPADLDELHSLIADAYVARYLLDGNRFAPAWTAARIEESCGLFQSRGVGLWLAYEVTSGGLVGFCGFLVLPDVHPEPQLIYALFERFAGQGFATEMASAAITQICTQDLAHGGGADLIASVDEVNVASLHVLEKLGFQRIGVQEGAFGRMLMLRLPVDRRWVEQMALGGVPRHH